MNYYKNLSHEELIALLKTKDRQIEGERLGSQRTNAEIERLKLNIQHALQYTHDEYLKGNLTEDFSDYIHQLLTQN